mgnify:CR=1 FL=1
MVITNDASLLLFVPESIWLFRKLKKDDWLPFLVVLETIAANMGSTLLPSGNPQNLYLSSFYQLAAGDFFAVTIPIVLLSFVLLAIGAVLLERITPLRCSFKNREEFRANGHCCCLFCCFAELAFCLPSAQQSHCACSYSNRIGSLFPEGIEEGRLLAACNLCLLLYLCRQYWCSGSGQEFLGKCFKSEHHALFGAVQPGYQ